MKPRNSFFEPFSFLARHKNILLRTTWSELKSTYAGSILGLLWIVVGPVLLLTVYALIYGLIFKVRPNHMTSEEYILYVFSGLVPFISFSTAMSQGALSLASNKQLLLNTVFPVELAPVKSVLVAHVALPVGTVILILCDLFVSELSLSFLFVPVVIIFQVMFLVGLSWVLSLATLLIKDLQQLLTYITMLLLVITPIAYTPDMIPPQLGVIIYGNPLFYFITSYQHLIVLNRVPPLEIVFVGSMMSLFMFVAGYHLYSRAKQIFYDLV